MSDKPDRPCPECGKMLEWEEGEDEFSGNELISYEGYWCNHCHFRFDEWMMDPEVWKEWVNS
jgi:C4-type Zn-finger protein